MKKSVIFLTCVVLILCSYGSVLAEDQTVTYRNIKTIGMGNARIAGGHSYNGFIDNPALLSRVEFLRFSVINVPVTINDDLMDIGDFINDNSDNFEKYDDLTDQERAEFLKDIEEYEGVWGSAFVSPLIDVAANVGGYGLGLAVYDKISTSLKVDRGIFEPRVWGEGRSDMAVVLGIAKPLTMLYPGLTVGVNLTWLERRRSGVFQIKASELGSLSDTLDPVEDNIKDNSTSTMAADIGVLWDVPLIDSQVGATIRSIGDGRGSTFDIGIARYFLEDHLLLLADMIDITDNDRENYLQKLNLGAQYSVWYFAARAGVYEGYATLGAGLNFRIVDLDFAWYTEEISNAPGLEDDSRLALQLKFGF